MKESKTVERRSTDNSINLTWDKRGLVLVKVVARSGYAER